MTLVAAIAGVGALVVLVLVVVVVRSRRPDEDARFRNAARLTSEWSREHQTHQLREISLSDAEREAQGVHGSVHGRR